MIITPIQAAIYKGVSLSDYQPPFLDSSSPLFTGIVCYAMGLTLLNVWETMIVPALQLRSILPDVPLIPGQFTQAEKSQSWITPLTANTQTPPKETLKERGRHVVGSYGTVRQLITLDTSHVTQTGVREVSPEWSEYYDDTVVIFKERMF